MLNSEVLLQFIEGGRIVRDAHWSIKVAAQKKRKPKNNAMWWNKYSYKMFWLFKWLPESYEEFG